MQSEIRIEGHVNVKPCRIWLAVLRNFVIVIRIMKWYVSISILRSLCCGAQSIWGRGLTVDVSRQVSGLM